MSVPVRGEYFLVPVASEYLFYAPLHALAALVDKRAAQQLAAAVGGDGDPPSPAVADLLDRLRGACPSPPKPRRAPLGLDMTALPLFLGLVPTHNCNMACRYCDFAPGEANTTMSFELAAAAVDGYLRLLFEAGSVRGEIHFFGGEPMFAAEVVQFAVGYALARASEAELALRFEITTNGLYSAARARWLADYFDTVILSLDGPPEIQNRLRPARNGRGQFATVARTARILAAADCELVLRCCVTAATVERLPQIAEMFLDQFRPDSVCFERLVVSPPAEAAGLEPPNPWRFAVQFEHAARLLESQGVPAISAAAELGPPRVTFCPVGQDALIVTPDGAIHGCYLPPEEWQQKDLSLTMGRVDRRDGLLLNTPAVANVRSHNVYGRERCIRCLGRYHCAGGCHVRRSPGPAYDDRCLQTRLLLVAGLLQELGQDARCHEWLGDRRSALATAHHPDDRLPVGPQKASTRAFSGSVR